MRKKPSVRERQTRYKIAGGEDQRRFEPQDRQLEERRLKRQELEELAEEEELREKQVRRAEAAKARTRREYGGEEELQQRPKGRELRSF